MTVRPGFRPAGLRRGSAMLEVALVLAVLSPLVAGGLRFAYSFYLIHSLQDAVASAAEYGSGLEYAGAAEFETAIRAKVAGAEVPRLDPAQVRVEVQPDAGGRPAWITVSIRGYSLPTPFSSTVLEGKPRARFPYRLRAP
ncbi:MAG: hypothetical protein R2762_25455 [Bryobacteraceae bacterium]